MVREQQPQGGGQNCDHNGGAHLAGQRRGPVPCGDRWQHHQPDRHQRAQRGEAGDDAEYHEGHEGEVNGGAGGTDGAHEFGVEAFENERPPQQREARQDQACHPGHKKQCCIINA